MLLLVTLRPKGSSLFDALKRVRLASKAESLESKLTAGQLKTLGLNKSIVRNTTTVADCPWFPFARLYRRGRRFPRLEQYYHS